MNSDKEGYMNTHQGQKKSFYKTFACKALGLLACLAGSASLADTVVVAPHTVIRQNTTFNNVILDMSEGSFILKNHALLTIQNSTIKGTLSIDNPVLINVEDGAVNLQNNQVTVKAIGLKPHPLTQSLQYFMQVGLGSVTMNGNKFSIDKEYTAGFLITSGSVATTGFNITNNFFSQFHGVLYLIASDNAMISNNTFTRNSYGNLVNIGNNNQIIHNTFAFSGNNRLGNAIDVIDSTNTSVRNNILLTPTCHGIYVLNSHGLLIDSNRIMGGITYAMNIYSNPETAKVDEYLKPVIAKRKIRNMISNNVTITNNFMSQNRYGLAVSDTDGLVVKNNTFIQRFQDDASRTFWTDNNTLLQNVTHLTWANNFYKEAFTQDILGDNSKSRMIVSFPVSGGVSL